MPYPVEEVDRILEELPSPPGDDSRTEVMTKLLVPSEPTRPLATSVPVWPTRISPTKTLYFVPPDFIQVIQLNGRGDFVASRFEGGGGWSPVFGRWDGELEVKRLTSTALMHKVGEFTATGIDDRGIVVGRVVTERPPPDHCSTSKTSGDRPM